MSFDFDNINKYVQLVCPLTHAPLVKDGDSLVTCDATNRLRYAIEDGIPVMLVEDAQEVPMQEWIELMNQHGFNPQTGEPLATND